MRWILSFLWLACTSFAAQPHRIALVGLNHDHVWPQLNTILRGDLATLVGIAETLPDRVARVEKEEDLAQGGKRAAVSPSLVFSDWRRMIDETKPDIVWAFLETNRHAEIVRYCAPRKIHVLFEYPLSVSLSDALQIQQLARQYGIQVLTNYLFWSWTAPPYAAKAAVDAGTIGPVYRLSGLLGHGGPADYRNSSFLTWLMTDEKNGGGALVDFGAPLVAWAVWIKGRPASVYARVDHLRPEEFNGTDDNSTVILNYRDGVAILEGTWDMAAAPLANNQIFGRAGSLVVKRDGVDLYKAGERPAGAPRRQAAPTALSVAPVPPERSGALAYLVDRIDKQQPVQDMSGLDLNVAVVEIFEAARASIKTARAITLPQSAEASNSRAKVN